MTRLLLSRTHGSNAAISLQCSVGLRDDNFRAFLRDRKNRKAIPHRLRDCGYVQVRNDDAEDGLWKIGGRRQVATLRKSFACVTNLPPSRS
jgi:hypothetical protein